jgi:hypothetical protein
MRIAIGNLISPSSKLEDTLNHLLNGELSHSSGIPPTVTYSPELKKHMIVDGNHRILQMAINGDTHIQCEINIHQKRIGIDID